MAFVKDIFLFFIFFLGKSKQNIVIILTKNKLFSLVLLVRQSKFKKMKDIEEGEGFRVMRQVLSCPKK